VRVELTNGNVVSGRATSLDADGRLVIETEGEKRLIDTGDVVHFVMQITSNFELHGAKK